jgi:NAD(P)-dependent dehydrogenase (short-subunit alcohol dehydrogenase family)
LPINVKNKLVLITGASGGVGYECARLFCRRGAKLLLVGRDEGRLQAACDKLRESGPGPVNYLAGDIRNSAFADEAVNFATGHLGGAVEILVNNAGTIVRSEAVNTSDEDWRELMAVNLDAVFYFSRAAARQMPAGSAIINISSTCGQVGAAGLAAYCASKGAVNQLTRAMALELAQGKISVNAVSPGAINSPMLYGGHPQDVTAQQVEERNLLQIPLAELASPEGVARSVFFLATEPHITGSILSIDGGYTAR